MISRYIDFQASSPSPYHVVSSLRDRLEAEGFGPLATLGDWTLEDGGSYYVIHPEQKALIAFSLGQHSPARSGYSLYCAHTDSPVLRLKLSPFVHNRGIGQLLTQQHGGLILRSWLDRPLALAGAIYELSKKRDKPSFDPQTGQVRLEQRLVASEKPLAVIPDLAIHLDRDKNSSGEINAETMMRAIFGCSADGAKLEALFERHLGADLNQVAGFELCLAPHWRHELVGLDEDFIVGPRHDDLAMVFAGLEALIDCRQQKKPRTAVVCFVDAEETGSLAAGGAASLFVRDVLLKLASTIDPSSAPLDCFSSSFVVSGDMAHAWHPAHPDKHAEAHCPSISGGLVLKENANDRYASSGLSSAVFRGLAEAAGITTQNFVVRQDMGCGSTIGPTLAAQLGAPTVDIGLPMWGMHSAAETMAVSGFSDVVRFTRTFFAGGAETALG